MNVRPIACVLAAVPLAFYAYACSSDSETPAATDGDGGTKDGASGPSGPSGPSGNPGDAAGSTSGNPGDAGDAAAANACVGNPLTSDGGTSDGGTMLDAGTTTELVITYPNVAGNSFLDGPQWIDADGGALIFSQLNSAPPQVLRVAPDGGIATALRSVPDGDLLLPIGNAVRNGIVLTTLSAEDPGQTPVIWQTYLDGGAGTSIGVGAATNPNDLVVGANGNIYFTDPQYQTDPSVQTGLYRVLADAGVELVQKDLARPNGIALSADNTKLYVGLGTKVGDLDAATSKGVMVFTVAADGSVTSPGTPFLVASDLADTPDGIAIDVGGNLWVAEANADEATTSGRVEVFGPDKKKLGTIPFPTKRPTGIAFGGANSKSVFITAEDGVFVFTSRCAGVR